MEKFLPIGIPEPVTRSFAGRMYECMSGIDEPENISFYDKTKYGGLYMHDIAVPSQDSSSQGDKKSRRRIRFGNPMIEWWASQCAYRGLDTDGDIHVLQQRIHQHGDLGMSDAIKRLRKEMVEEYQCRRFDMIDIAYQKADTTGKAKYWPQRFLKEFFGDPISTQKVLALEMDERGSKMAQAVRSPKLCCERKPLYDAKAGQYLSVIGVDQIAVSAKLAEITRETQQAALRAVQQQRQTQIPSQVGASNMTSSSQEQLAVSDPWDVSGKWGIRCSHIEANYPSGRKCSLEFGFTRPNSAGQVQMYARFDFNIYTGIIRVLDPAEPKYTQKYINGSCFVNENFQLEYEDEQDEHPSTTQQFLISHELLPSSASREFNFRWRGEETGEGVIERWSERALCLLTFKSEDRLIGTVETPLTGRIDFVGEKASSTNPDSTETQVRKRKRVDEGNTYWPDPADAWSSRSEAAYEQASRDRWRRW